MESQNPLTNQFIILWTSKTKFLRHPFPKRRGPPLWNFFPVFRKAKQDYLPARRRFAKAGGRFLEDIELKFSIKFALLPIYQRGVLIVIPLS
jgi:hypothetical protein